MTTPGYPTSAPTRRWLTFSAAVAIVAACGALTGSCRTDG